MRICVYGAGAIGGHMAMRLDAGGAEVSILARGETLRAIAADGLSLRYGEERFHARLPAAAEPEDLPRPDVVIVAVKSQGLAGIAERLGRLAAGGVPVVFALNGLPWWYRRMLRARAAAAPAPDGSDEAALGPILPARQVIGCSVTSSNRLERPGSVVNEIPSANRFVFGPADPALAPVCEALAALMTRGRATGVATGDVTIDIWRKLQLNLVTHGFGCLTGLDSRTMLSSPVLRPLAEQVVRDSRALAAACGVEIAADPAFLDPARFAAHKTSMLQDLEKGNVIEYHAVFGAAVDVADWFGVEAPSLRLVAGLLREKANAMGLLPQV